MATPKHCPGFELSKHLEVLTCKCPNCGEEKEIFSDEFNKKHVCKKCAKEIDFAKAALSGKA